MASGTFTYNALRTKTLKKRIQTQRKIVLKSFKLDQNNAVSIGTSVIKPFPSIILSGLRSFCKVLCKIDSGHLFSYGGLHCTLFLTFMCNNNNINYSHKT